MMAPEYANNQPKGFVNRIEHVAIIGASGQIGLPVTDALLRTGKHTVTAITRGTSQSKLPDGVKTVKVDYDDESSLIKALKGQQVLIISLSVASPPGTQDKIVLAAAKAGVPHVMPNAWGSDTKNEKLAADQLVGANYLNAVKFVEAQGLFWTNLCSSFWYEYSLALPFAYGIDAPNKRATLYDSGSARINTSTWQQCGRAVAAWLSLKALPDSENDNSPTVASWRNKPLYISSFLLSQREMLDSVQRVQGTSDADWDIASEPAEARYKRGMEMLQAGDRSGFGTALYARQFTSNSTANYESSRGLDNSKLDLPEEDLDKATARSLAMSNSGWNPFGNRSNVKLYD